MKQSETGEGCPICFISVLTTLEDTISQKHLFSWTPYMQLHCGHEHKRQILNCPSVETPPFTREELARNNAPPSWLEVPPFPEKSQLHREQASSCVYTRVHTYMLCGVPLDHSTSQWQALTVWLELTWNSLHKSAWAWTHRDPPASLLRAGIGWAWPYPALHPNPFKQGLTEPEVD